MLGDVQKRPHVRRNVNTGKDKREGARAYRIASQSAGGWKPSESRRAKTILFHAASARVEIIAKALPTSAYSRPRVGTFAKDSPLRLPRTREACRKESPGPLRSRARKRVWEKTL
jgi:hypothetical protein